MKWLKRSRLESKSPDQTTVEPDKLESLQVAKVRSRSDISVALINHLPLTALIILILVIFFSFKEEIRKSLPSVNTFEYAGIKINLNHPQESIPKKLEGGPDVDVQEWKAAKRRALDRADLIRNKKILWVDDHPENNTELVKLLTAFDVEITTATSNQEAFALLKSSKDYDIIITDIGRDHESDPNLPDKDPNNTPNEVGLNLIQRAASVGYSDRILVFSGHFAPDVNSSPPRRNWPVGAYGVTNQPDELLNLIIDLSYTIPKK